MFMVLSTEDINADYEVLNTTCFHHCKQNTTSLSRITEWWYWISTYTVYLYEIKSTYISTITWPIHLSQPSSLLFVHNNLVDMRNKRSDFKFDTCLFKRFLLINMTSKPQYSQFRVDSLWLVKATSKWQFVNFFLCVWENCQTLSSNSINGNWYTLHGV